MAGLVGCNQSLGRSSGTSRPVLDLQSWHLSKVLFVVGHQDQFQRQGVSSDHGVERSDWRAALGEVCGQAAVLIRGVDVEVLRYKAFRESISLWSFFESRS